MHGDAFMNDSKRSWHVDFTPVPKTAEDVARADAEDMAKTENMKKHIRLHADYLRNRNEVDGTYSDHEAANLLSYLEENLADVHRPKRRGQPPQLPGDIHIHLAFRMAKGETQGQGIKAIAEEFGVSEQAVRKKLKNMGWKNFSWARSLLKKK
jgi:hypothetical protein